MKRILVIHHSSIIGGAGISLLNMINICKESYNITVFVSDLHDDFYNILKLHKIDVFQYNGRIAALYYHASSRGVLGLAFLYRLLLIPIQYRYWKKVIKKQNPDLVIVNSLVLSWMSIISNNLNIKSLCFVRETFVNKNLKLITKLQQKLLSGFTGVSFISEYDKYIANLPEKVNVFVNNNFMDCSEEYNENNKRDNTLFKVLYIGGVNEIKGINIILEVARLLKSYSNIKFDILGEDYRTIEKEKNQSKFFNNSSLNFLKSVNNYIDEHGLHEKLIFHGIQREINYYYKNCDIVVLPITTPHQQRGIFEAGCFSKPVIVSNFDQLHWAVKPGYNGEFFEPNNANDLVMKILEFYNNSNKCIKQGLNNKKLTQQNHTKEVCNRKVLETIKSIINE